MRGLRLLTLGLVASVAVLAARPAQAGILVEPYLGYELGTLKYTGSPNASFDLSSAALGLRAGVTFPLLFVALDYSVLLGGSAKDDTAAATKWDASGSQLFAEVGAQLPLIRAYLGYGIANTFELKSGGTTNKFENGTTIKAGVGTTVFPLIAVNLEYITSSYDKLNGNSPSDSKSNFFMLNLSVPFDL